MTLCRCGDPLGEHRLEAGEKRGEINVRACRAPGCACEQYVMLLRCSCGAPLTDDPLTDDHLLTGCTPEAPEPNGIFSEAER